MEIHVFSAPGDGIDPAVMLTVGQRPKAQYLINVPEGFSRYVLEHKVRPGLGLRAVFCSDLMSATGISGLIMRLRGEGHGCIELMGPPGTFQFLTSLQHFIHWRHPAVLLTEINSHENYTMPLYSDEYMDVSPLWPGGGCPEWLSGLATKHDMARTHATYNDADYSDVLEQDQISCEGESSSTTSSSEEKDIRKKSSSLPSLMVREQRTQSVRMGENNCIVVHGRTYDQSNGEQDGGGRICTYRQREPVGENPSVTGLKGNSASMSFIFYVRTPMCNAICLYIHCTNVEEVEAWVRHPVCQILNNVWPSKRFLATILRIPPPLDKSSPCVRLLLETLPSHAPVYIVYPTGPGAPPTLGFLSSARITARLNLVSRRMFPLPACLQSTALAESRNPAPASNYVTPSSSERQVYTLDRLTRLVWESSGRLVSVQTGEQGRTQGDVNLDALHDSLLSADPLLKQRLENVQKAFPALNERVNTRERAQGEAKRRKISNRSAAAALKARLAGGPLPNKDEESGEELGEEPELVFLGTGSAEPSKYRGASAIYVRIGGKNSGEDRGVNRITCRGFLLDCGEGTWGHLVRQLGPAQALKVVINLGFVWISHRHADHMSGLLRIIAIYSQEVGDEEENKVQERRPLLIIGPNALGLWLQKAVPAMLGIEKTSQLIRFIHCGDITDGSGLQKSPSIQTACQSSGLTLIQAIRVRHCSDAWGIVLGHDTGWSLAYSGDTEPCDALSRAAQGVSVLIHEATFEPRLHGEARRKRHSTTLEALSVAREMKACATVLTHFSQRYPKFPEGLSSDDKDGDESNLIAVAFDGMRLPFSCIPALSAVTKCVELLLALKSDTVDGNQFKH